MTFFPKHKYIIEANFRDIERRVLRNYPNNLKTEKENQTMVYIKDFEAKIRDKISRCFSDHSTEALYSHFGLTAYSETSKVCRTSVSVELFKKLGGSFDSKRDCLNYYKAMNRVRKDPRNGFVFFGDFPYVTFGNCCGTRIVNSSTFVDSLKKKFLSKESTKNVGIQCAIIVVEIDSKTSSKELLALFNKEVMSRKLFCQAKKPLKRVECYRVFQAKKELLVFLFRDFTSDVKNRRKLTLEKVSRVSLSRQKLFLSAAGFYSETSAPSLGNIPQGTQTICDMVVPTSHYLEGSYDRIGAHGEHLEKEGFSPLGEEYGYPNIRYVPQTRKFLKVYIRLRKETKMEKVIDKSF